MFVRIQEPYWGAWKKFGWAKGIWGVGFKAKDIDKAIKSKEQLEVTIYKFKDTYKISPVTVRNFAEKNNCTYTARHGTKLYVVPNTKLKKVTNGESDPTPNKR